MSIDVYISMAVDNSVQACSRLREQRHGLGDASAQGIRRPQGLRQQGEIDGKVCVVTDTHSAFEQGKRPRQLPLAEDQQTDTPHGQQKACGVIHAFGNPEPLFADGEPLGKHAELGMARSKPGTGGHGGQDSRPRSVRGVAPRRGPPWTA